jgi:hypothetical protein
MLPLLLRARVGPKSTSCGRAIRCFAAAWQQALDSADGPPQPVDRGFRARAKLAGALISGEITPREAADLSTLIDEYLKSVELGKLE